MAFLSKYLHGLLPILLLLPTLCYSQDFILSRAAYYGSPDCLGTPTGACGFGEYGKTVNDANVAAVSKLYRNGTGCGACYQVRCKAPQLCTDEGVNIVVTDYGEGDHTDFILSTRAYARMARPNAAYDLFAYGVVDVEYRRIPCRYVGYNLMVMVKEQSRPDYLAIIPLYQAGIDDIVAAEIWQEEYKAWRGMRKAYGAVWDTPNPPKGPMTLRFLVSAITGVTWVQLPVPIPADWKAGVAYDTTIQLN